MSSLFESGILNIKKYDSFYTPPPLPGPPSVRLLQPLCLFASSLNAQLLYAAEVKQRLHIGGIKNQMEIGGGFALWEP